MVVVIEMVDIMTPTTGCERVLHVKSGDYRNQLIDE